MHMRGRAGFVVAALSAGLFTAALYQPATANAATVDSAVKTAAKYATSRGYRTGIAVVDLKTGKTWTGGSATAEFPTESVVKVFIATRILLQGRMHGTTATRAYKMVTQSDDAIASSFYASVGGAGIEPWIENHYKIKNLGSRPSTYPGNWGNTKITAVGMAQFYAKVKKDKKVGPWLLNAMHHAHHYGSDGFDQFFGLKVADPNAAIKQGWGGDDNHFNSTVMPSTGYVDGDRYAVALLTMHIPYTSYGNVRKISNAQAKLLLPHGHIDNPTTHGPHLRLPHAATGTEGVHTEGSIVHITGWATDRDAPSRSLTVVAYSRLGKMATTTTTIDRPDVNRAMHVTGRHGYRLTFRMPNGRFTFCVVAMNVGPGSDVRKCAAQVRVNGNPEGYYDSARIVAKHPVLTGWAYDRDRPSGSSMVRVVDNGKLVGDYRAAVARPDVNRRKHVSGKHGFVITLTGSKPGRHTYTVYTLKSDVHHGRPYVSMGAKTVTVPR